jgi:superfamily II DNA or RNA helicase
MPPPDPLLWNQEAQGMAGPWKTLAELRSLPEEEQAVLMGLAGLGLPCTNSHLALTLGRAGGFPQAQAWIENPRKVQDLLARLKSRGLLEERRGFWHCSEASLESSARLAFARGVLRRLYQAGHTAGPGAGMMPDGALRSRAELRMVFMEGLTERWMPLRERFADQYSGAVARRDPLALICSGPFEPEWFDGLDPAAQAFGCNALLQDHTLHNHPAPGWMAWMDAHTRTLAPSASAMPFIQYLILQGRLPEARAWMEAQPPRIRQHYAWSNLEALAALAEGKPALAAERYGASLAALRKVTRKKNAALPGFHDAFHILALLGTREPVSLRLADERIALLDRGEWSSPLKDIPELLAHLSRLLSGARPGRDSHLGPPRDLSPLALVLAAVAAHLGADTLPPDLPERALRACAPLPFGWFAAELTELNRRLRGETPRPSALLDLVPREAAWERTLDSLERLGAPATGAPKIARLAWFIKAHAWDPDAFEVQAREQKVDAKGEWTRGRPVSLRKLRENGKAYDYLTAQDQKVISAIKVENHYGSDLTFQVDGAEALAALVGHPCVLWEGPDGFRPVALAEGKPELRVRRLGDALELRLEPEPGPGGVLALEEGPDRRRVYVFQDHHRRLRELLGERLVVPVSAQERVLRSLAAVAPLVDIHSDLGISDEVSARAGLERAEGRTGPTLVLVPSGEGLRIQVRVSPVAGGPSLLPGQGGASLVVEQEGRRLLVRRNLEQEVREAQDLVAALPLGESDGWDWSLADPEACLELLMQAEALKGGTPVLWPEGEHLKAPRAVGLEAMRLKAGAAGGWLELEGELRVDGTKVLDLKALLELVSASRGRFVPMGDGTFLALSKAFRRRLLDLNALGEVRGEGLRLHASAAVLLGDLEQGLDAFEGDRAFRLLAARVRAAMALEPPLPTTLEAELRDYQAQGYRWLMRLAEAGLGACLADDMGLGKTLQALAVLLARGGAGPALVVAPTSVCANWQNEAARFAPALRLHNLAEHDRERLLEQAGPMDVVVTSYGLLHQESERLAKVAWSTVILDEPQAIKNAFTKRSKAAMALKAGFRLVLSGTPVENHLGELWNILRFLNPGLMGTLDQFQVRFQIPIERLDDPEALKRLKRVVGPFLLRRTKAQVLEELPPRTEITLEVEPSPEEAAFLEALRQRSLEELEDLGEGQAIQVLAAIMRLRRACCHPELAQPGIGIPSSKAEAFLELLAHMRENKHRALVFSQFVDHLALIRQALEAQGVPYLYLDGGTPARARAKAVAAFQSGEGEVFLISLKAGGTGLNLTGADYVIHMDPWWNPAVEDQASDRAHRIGQTRPVTIYRLVLRGSIEQKIVALHARKRQLADNLLEGAAAPARLDAEALMELLRQ